MFDVSATLEGVPELRTKWRGACRQLRNECAKETNRAARAGVRAAKDRHPYTDRTGNLTNTSYVEMVSTSDEETTALMQWPQEYASYVDLGTERSRAYPFTPHAEETMRLLLEARVRFHVTGLIVALL